MKLKFDLNILDVEKEDIDGIFECIGFKEDSSLSTEKNMEQFWNYLKVKY